MLDHSFGDFRPLHISYVGSLFFQSRVGQNLLYILLLNTNTFIFHLLLHDFLSNCSEMRLSGGLRRDGGDASYSHSHFARRFHSLFRGCKFSSSRIVTFPSRHVPTLTACQGRLPDLRRQCRTTGAKEERKEGARARGLSRHILVEIDFSPSQEVLRCKILLSPPRPCWRG